MSDERDRFPAENDDTEETDVEAHRHAGGSHRNDVAMNDEGEKAGDEPDVEAHRHASGSHRHDGV